MIRQTSLAAVQSIAPIRGKMKAEIYNYIACSKGMTCAEIEHELMLSHQTASARIRDLVKEAKLYDGGQRRLTGTGRRAIVWQAS